MTLEHVVTHLMFAIMFFVGLTLIYDPDAKTRDAKWLQRFFLAGFITINGFRWGLIIVAAHFL